jgi:hypothetical protein
MKEASSLSSGFGALISVLLVSAGTITLSLSAMIAASDYSDSVLKSEQRAQAALNAMACQDSAALIRAQNIFAKGIVRFSEFDCSVTL